MVISKWLQDRSLLLSCTDENYGSLNSDEHNKGGNEFPINYGFSFVNRKASRANKMAS